MMVWLERHAAALGSIGTMLAGIAALMALGGMGLQIRSSEHAQALQTARTAYLAQQALAVANPQFADPADACALLESDKGNAYEAFVTHLLYTAEQVLAVEPGWEESFLYEMIPHAAYLCTYSSKVNAAPGLAELIREFETRTCTAPERVCKTAE